MSQELPKNTVASMVAQVNKRADLFMLESDAVTVTSYRQMGPKYVRVFFTIDRGYGKSPAEIQALRRRFVMTNAVIPDPFAEGAEPIEPETPTDTAVTGFTVTGPAEVDVGQSINMAVSILPADATDKTYTVAVSKPGVVEILNNGAILKGLVADTVNVTYTANGGEVPPVVKAITVKAVVVKPQTITATYDSDTVEVGDLFEPTVAFTPANSTDKSVTLSSSDPAVIKVTEGVFEAVAEGTAQLTVTSVATPSAQSTRTITVATP